MPTIDLSSSTDPRITVASDVLAELAVTAGRHGIPFMVIGATARDILSTALVGAPPARATADVDIAVAVPSWRSFDALAVELDRAGRRRHTFVVSGLRVDVVPFGGVETGERTIAWGDGTVMSTVGLREAYDTSITAALPHGTVVRVPSVAGLTSLKLTAWSDRRLETRRDAVDLQSIIGWCASGSLLDALYEDGIALLEAYDFDPDLAAAHRLGLDMAASLGSAAPRALALLDDDNVARLVADMPPSVADQSAILLALRAGLGGHRAAGAT